MWGLGGGRLRGEEGDLYYLEATITRLDMDAFRQKGGLFRFQSPWAEAARLEQQPLKTTFRTAYYCSEAGFYRLHKSTRSLQC